MPPSDVKEILQDWRDLWKEPYAALANRAESGERLLGYFCSYTPEEMLHAAGFTPVRIVGQQRNVDLADTHLQGYCCSLARTDLDMALAGDLAWLEGAVFVQTCDTMQRLSDIWRLNTGFAYHGDVVLPARLGDPLAERYLVEELRSFRTGLEKYAGAPVGDEALRESIRIYNRNRELLGRLYEMLAAGAGITGTEVLSCVMAGMWMRKEKHNELLEKLLAGLENQSAPVNGRLRLLISGSLCTTPEFTEMVEGMGALIADDDLCCGHRYIEGEAAEEGDPVVALARRLSERVICPAKHSPGVDRAAYLVDKAGRAGARGAIFFLQNFCDPHAFDFPWLRERLQQEGVAVLLLESQLQTPALGQMQTRVEAFLEMIRGA